MNPKFTFTQLHIRFFLAAIWLIIILPVSAATFDSATSGNWNLAATWTLTSGTDADGVPDADDAVTIKAGDNVTATGGSTCTTITVDAMATLTLTSALNNSGTFLNQGTLEWTSGAFVGAGAIFNDGTINISGIVTALHNTGADITNNAGGTINWLNGYIDGSSSGQTLTNYGIFNLIGDNPSNRTCEMTIVNKSGGSIIKGGTTSSGLSIDVPFTNESGGTVTIHSGASISFLGNFTLTQNGTFTVDGTLNLASGTISQGQVFSVNGVCNVTLGTHTFGVGFSGPGTLVVSGGTVTFDSGSTLSTKLTQSGGILNDNVGLMPGEVTITGGTYQGSGSPTFANGFTWNGGTITGSGVVTVSGNFVSNTGSLNLTGSKELRIASTGTISCNTPRTLGFSSGSSKLTIASTGSLTFDGSSTLGISGGPNTLFAVENGGNLAKTGSGTATINPLVSLAAGSTINIDNGALIFNGASQTYNFTEGSVSITAPGSFTLANSITSTFNLSGITISGTGTLITSAVTTNVNAGTSITSKLSITVGSFNDNIGLMPGEVTLGGGGSYQGTGSPNFAHGFIWNGGNIAGSGIVTVSGTMTASGTGSRFIQNTKELHLSGTGTFINAGINVNGGTKLLILSGGALTIDLPGSVATLGNGSTGIIEVQTGGALIKTGSNQLNVNGQLLLSGGNLTISEGLFNVSAIATHTYSGGTVVVNGTGDFRHINGNTANFSNVAVSGTGTFSLLSSTTANFNAGSSLSCKVNNNGTINDHVGLMPGEVTMSGNYGGTGSPTFANGFIWDGGQLNGSGTVTMSGIMTGASGSRSLFGSKILRITGMGTFTSGGIQLAQTSSLLIANGGSLTIDNAASANVSINGSLPSATMEVQAGGSFTKTGAGTLTVSNAPFVNNGTLTVSNGELTLANSTTHSGNFNVATGATLNFSNTTTNTTFAGINFTNNGTVSVGAGRSLVFAGASQQFLHGNGNTIASLTLNNAQNLNIQGSQNVTAFTFTSGKAYLQNGDLTVGTLSGADANKYFVTQGTGRLIQSVATTSKLFPVGSGISSYNPVTLQQVGGTASFGVRVKLGFDYPTNGDGYVNRQWTIDHTEGTPNTNVTFQWSPADATMTFDPDNCHISRYSGGGWNSFGEGAAACGATCIRTQNGVTQFSPFGIGTGAALPVELIHFEGLFQNERVLLTWQTASELNAAWYQIERSADGLKWINIGKVAAQGTSNQTFDYTFADRSPLPQGYYRLRMEDLDGTFQYSPVVSVSMKTKDFLLKNLYPNPVSTELTLQIFSPAEGEIHLKITDVSGTIRHTERIHSTINFFNKILDVSELEPGIYFIEVSMDENRRVHRFAKR